MTQSQCLDESERVIFQQRMVEIVRAGRGKPLIVLESGLGDDWSSWSPVLPQLAQRSRTLAYSRPGYGASTPVDTTRDPFVEARELHLLLQTLGEAPPYLLIGHSWGGLIAQAYADAFAKEVIGMVLVDPTHPSLIERMRRDTPEDAKTFDGIVQHIHDAAFAELTALRALRWDHFQSGPMLYAGPVIVLAAWLEDLHGSATYPRQHRILARETAARYPQAQLREIACKHYIQREQPQAVVDAVEEILDGL